MGGLILNCLFLIFDVGIYFGVFLMILSPTTGLLLSLIPVAFWLWKYFQATQYQPTKKQCPNCHGNNIEFGFKNNGSITTFGENTAITSNMNQKIAICKDCGTSFPFSASNEIAGYKASRMKLVVFFAVIAIVIYLIAPIWQRM